MPFPNIHRMFNSTSDIAHMNRNMTHTHKSDAGHDNVQKNEKKPPPFVIIIIRAAAATICRTTEKNIATEIFLHMHENDTHTNTKSLTRPQNTHIHTHTRFSYRFLNEYARKSGSGFCAQLNAQLTIHRTRRELPLMIPYRTLLGIFCSLFQFLIDVLCRSRLSGVFALICVDYIWRVV